MSVPAHHWQKLLKKKRKTVHCLSFPSPLQAFVFSSLQQTYSNAFTSAPRCPTVPAAKGQLPLPGCGQGGRWEDTAGSLAPSRNPQERLCLGCFTYWDFTEEFIQKSGS